MRVDTYINTLNACGYVHKYVLRAYIHTGAAVVERALRMYVCMQIPVDACTHVCMYACMNPYTTAAPVCNANPSVCMYIRMYVCTYVYIHTYVCIHKYVCFHIHNYRSSGCTKSTTPSSEKSWALVCGLRTPSG